MAFMASVLIMSAGCDDDDSGNSSGSGTVVFTANGEGFVDEGFTSEDGWDIQFDHVYVNIEGPTAYQIAEESGESQFAAHAGHPHEEIPEGAAHVALAGEYFVDLKREASGASVFEIGRVNNAAVGNYNYLNFNLRNVHTTGKGAVTPCSVLQGGDTTQPFDYEGYCLVLIGVATYPSDGPATTTVNFTIKFDQQMAYSGCGPQEDIDEDGNRDGILRSGGAAKTQITFHFERLFGDFRDTGVVGENPPDPDYVNFWGIGFSPFAELGGATLDIDSDDMNSGMTPHVYFHLYATLKTLGHLGESSCGCKDYNPDI